MSNSSLLSQFIIILVTAVISIAVALNHQSISSNPGNSVRSPAITQSSSTAESTEPVEPTEPVAPTEPVEPTEPAELPPKLISPEVVTDRATTYQTTAAFEQYKPKYFQATIHSSNYGDRYGADVNGNPLNNAPIVVLHETTNSLSSAINTFRTPHGDDNKQVSYHTLIALDGTIIYLVPSDKRAFGAGNSVFESPEGVETVKTNPNLPSSVNNFAYHISLVTPPDGRNRPNQSSHSGYTDSQYKSLAWLLALSNIPDDRITTHKDVDRSGHRFDPRSFDFDKFFQILHTYRQPTTVEAGTSTK